MSFASTSARALAPLRRPAAQASRTFAAEASRSRTPPSAVTPEDAQAFFARTLSLPSSAADAAIPADIALQALTHKSYQFVHRISHPPPYTAAEIAQNQASHNGRLSFLGRRALAAYQAMFLHAALGSSEAVREADVLRGRDIESMLAALRHVNNLGRFVGDKWGIESVMRWDRNTTSRDGGHAKVKGTAVEAVIGAIFTTHGSGAAQRAYHAHVLPHLAPQLRDPALKEAAERIAENAREGGVLRA